MNLTSTFEGIGIALDALRSNRVRAALTVLGIVIGVATVMTMAAAIGGFRSTVLGGVSRMGPNNFIVERFDGTQIRVSDGTDRPPWEGKPPITFEEARMLEELPSVRAVVPALDGQGEVKAGAVTVSDVPVFGRGARWPEYDDGDFVRGRNYVASDDERASPVTVISLDLAERLFGGSDPVGRQIRVNGEQLTVVGVYKLADNLFASSFKNWLFVPASTQYRRLKADPDFMSLLIVTAPGYTQEDAMDDVTAALRTSRGVGAGEENTFALTRPEQITELFNQITGVFFVVMLILSSVGLIVGGVGVIGIMMISVTERTREIGVRKALGATPREILWQFLVEAMTVTVVGGVIGLLVALGFTGIIRALTPVPAAIPAWAIAASVAVAAIGGMGFGLYPAFKAARLDPVDALRYE